MFTTVAGGRREARPAAGRKAVNILSLNTQTHAPITHWRTVKSCGCLFAVFTLAFFFCVLLLLAVPAKIYKCDDRLQRSY